MAFCPNCGSRVPDGAKFCTNCGTNLVEEEKKKKGIPAAAGILAVLMLLAVLCGGGFLLYSRQPSVRIRKYLNLGMKYLAEEKYDEAVLAFEKVIGIDPKRFEAYEGMADAYEGERDYLRAVRVLEQGLEAAGDPEPSRSVGKRMTEYYMILAEEAFEAGEGEQSAEFFEKVEEMESDDPETGEWLEVNRTKFFITGRLDLNSSREDYIKAYRESFLDAKKLHEEQTAERLSYGTYTKESEIPYNGISYTLCDITGDGIRELIICQVTDKHGEKIRIYSMKDGKPYLMGESYGDTLDSICAGYRSGYLYWSGYKGSYGLYYREWNGTEFTDSTLFESTWDYWERGDGPKEPLSFEELGEYYDSSRITDHPSEWVVIGSFDFYTEEHDSEMFDGEGAAAAYRPLLDMYYSCLYHGWPFLDGQNEEDPCDPDSASFVWSRHKEDFSYYDAGYLLRDLNQDGIPELIMTISQWAEDGTGVDLYTIRDGKIAHLSTSGERYWFMIREDGAVIEDGSGGALLHITDVYVIDGSQEMKLVQTLEIDGERDPQHPYFAGVDKEHLAGITEEEADAIIARDMQGAPFIPVPMQEYGVSPYSDLWEYDHSQ